MRSRSEHDIKDNAWLLVKSDDRFANTEMPNVDRSVVSGLTIEELRKYPNGKKTEISDGKK